MGKRLKKIEENVQSKAEVEKRKMDARLNHARLNRLNQLENDLSQKETTINSSRSQLKEMITKVLSKISEFGKTNPPKFAELKEQLESLASKLDSKIKVGSNSIDKKVYGSLQGQIDIVEQRLLDTGMIEEELSVDTKTYEIILKYVEEFEATVVEENKSIENKVTNNEEFSKSGQIDNIQNGGGKDILKEEIEMNDANESILSGEVLLHVFAH